MDGKSEQGPERGLGLLAELGPQAELAEIGGDIARRLVVGINRSSALPRCAS
jgi:hypothetical protein